MSALLTTAALSVYSLAYYCSMHCQCIALLTTEAPVSSFAYYCSLPVSRVVHNFFHVGDNVISWRENMATLQLFTVGGSGGMLPQGNFANFRCSEAHSGAFWGIQRSTRSFLRRGSSSKSSLLADCYWNTGNHLHGLGSIYTIALLYPSIHRRRKQILS